MLNLKTFTIRLIMTILFLGALSTTFHRITGVDINTVMSSMDMKGRLEPSNITLGKWIFNLKSVKANTNPSTS